MKRILFLLCLLSISFTAFAENTILIMGDSLSAGFGIDYQKSWPVLLQKKLATEKLDFRVTNASISGNTTSNGLLALPSLLKKYRPYMTIIELGANDGLRGLDLSTIKNNLQQMITSSKKHGKVLLVGLRLPPNYGVVYNQKFHAIFIDLAKENQIALVPFFLKGIDNRPTLMQPDGLHPTDEAQEMLLNNLWPTLKPLLA